MPPTVSIELATTISQSYWRPELGTSNHDVFCRQASFFLWLALYLLLGNCFGVSDRRMFSQHRALPSILNIQAIMLGCVRIEKVSYISLNSLKLERTLALSSALKRAACFTTVSRNVLAIFASSKLISYSTSLFFSKVTTVRPFLESLTMGLSFASDIAYFNTSNY